MTPGPRNLITDVPGLHVGNAQDDALKSGVTVLTADHPFTASVAVMGGAPGTRDTDLLDPDKSVPGVDALVLSGGSAFGLDAAGGVMAGLRDAGRGFAVGAARVPLVPAAILFDLLNGGDKDWTDTPYPALGRAALANASDDFAIGTHGVGTGATTGSLKGGLGSASWITASGHTIGALVAVNPVGNTNPNNSRYFWAAPFEQDDEFGGLGPDPDPRGLDPVDSIKIANLARQANTTIGIVATDAALTKAQAKRMATAAHDGIARAIVPAHTPMDGDLIFSAATGARALGGDADMFDICHAGATTMARAIARAVHAATQAPGDMLPCWGDL